MRLAVVGSRQGADLEHVREFISALPRGPQPISYAYFASIGPDSSLVSDQEITIVSGGADGVDRTAEQTWLNLGGKVVSFRPKKIDPAHAGQGEEYGIEVWELGGDRPRVYMYEGYPTGASYKDAAFLRDILIAETCDRLVAFYKRNRSWGASPAQYDRGFTQGWAKDMNRPTFEFEAA